MDHHRRRVRHRARRVDQLQVVDKVDIHLSKLESDAVLRPDTPQIIVERHAVAGARIGTPKAHRAARDERIREDGVLVALDCCQDVRVTVAEDVKRARRRQQQ